MRLFLKIILFPLLLALLPTTRTHRCGLLFSTSSCSLSPPLQAPSPPCYFLYSLSISVLFFLYFFFPCPTHRNQIFFNFPLNFPIAILARNCSFLILSLSVRLTYHLSIFISAYCISSSCLLVTDTHSTYIVAGLNIFLYTCPFNFSGTLL